MPVALSCLVYTHVLLICFSEYVLHIMPSSIEKDIGSMNKGLSQMSRYECFRKGWHMNALNMWWAMQQNDERASAVFLLYDTTKLSQVAKHGEAQLVTHFLLLTSVNHGDSFAICWDEEHL